MKPIDNKLIASLFYRPYLVLTKESLTLKVDLRGNSSVRCALQNIRALSRLVYWLMMQLVKIWNDHRLAILNLVEISLCITWNDSNLSWISYLQKNYEYIQLEIFFLQVLAASCILRGFFLIYDGSVKPWQRKHSYPLEMC